MLSLISGISSLLQTWSAPCVGLACSTAASGLGPWSGGESYFTCLHFVGSDILLFVGSSFSRLNLADCVRILVSRLLSRMWSPVRVSVAWMGADLRATVMILETWFCILAALSKFDFAAVPQEEIPYSRNLSHASDVQLLLYAVIGAPGCPREFLHKCHMRFCSCGTLLDLTFPGHAGIERDSKVRWCGC